MLFRSENQLIRGKALHKLGSCVDDTEGRGRPGEDARHRHHEHDHRRADHSVGQGGDQHLEGYGLVDEQSHEQGVEDAHYGRFRGSRYACVNGAKDDHRSQERPDGLDKGLSYLLQGSPLRGAAEIVLFRGEVDCSDQEKPDDDAGDDAAQENKDDRDIREIDVYDESDSGREDGRQLSS